MSDETTEDKEISMSKDEAPMVVERVARALYDAEWAKVGGMHSHWDRQPQDARDYWIFSARAAIAAYRLARRELAPEITINPESLTDAE